MLEFMTAYGVPAGVFVLMLITGTEVATYDFRRTAKHPRAVLLGAVGQLVMLAPMTLVVAKMTALAPSIAAALLLLALCPGGAISNYYCYLARCSVSLSATITAIGTLCSLATIPLWLQTLSGFIALNHDMMQVPVWRVLVQLIAFMVVPMAAGMIVRRRFPAIVERNAETFRRVSFAIVLVILALTSWAVRGDIATVAGDIAIAAILFILGAMLLGKIMAYGMAPWEGPVLVIESAVRNIGVALIIGRNLLGDQAFGAFASFLTVYFTLEMVIMLGYSHFVRTRLGRIRSAGTDPAE